MIEYKGFDIAVDGGRFVVLDKAGELVTKRTYSTAVLAKYSIDCMPVIEDEPIIKPLEMIDITGAEYVEILIKSDGSVIWINTDTHCVLRICQIKELRLIDQRVEQKPKTLFGGRNEHPDK